MYQPHGNNLLAKNIKNGDQYWYYPRIQNFTLNYSLELKYASDEILVPGVTYARNKLTLNGRNIGMGDES